MDHEGHSSYGNVQYGDAGGSCIRGLWNGGHLRFRNCERVYSWICVHTHFQFRNRFVLVLLYYSPHDDVWPGERSGTGNDDDHNGSNDDDHHDHQHHHDDTRHDDHDDDRQHQHHLDDAFHSAE